MKGRLNLFQEAMLRWREIHPYSAVHAIRIDQPLDAERLSSVIDGRLEALGLTGLTLDFAHARFEYTGGAAHSMLAVHAGGAEPMQVLQREIERELNTPFPHQGPLVPFRFFAIEADAYFHLAITYDHFIAAGDSIVVLLEGMVSAYRGGGTTLARPLQRYPATCRRLFRHHPRAALRGMCRVREMVASCRRSVRPRYPGGPDPRNGFVYCRVAPPEFAALIRTTKAWGVTVNDLLMAILLQVLEPLAGNRPSKERRHEIALASIVNLRHEFGYDDTTFGQFLSSFRVSHPLPAGIPLQQLARDIHSETARIKSERLYLQSLLAIGANNVLWRLLSPRQRLGFYTKNYPAWAAITMVNVDALWSEAAATTTPSEYLRAVSTGPLAPLVVAVTTSAGVLHAGISYRTAAHSPAVIAKLAAGFVDLAGRLGP